MHRHTRAIFLVVLAVFAAGGRPAVCEDLRIGLSADVTSVDPHWNNSGPNVSLATHISSR